MLETLKNTCQFLSQERITVQETANYLGKLIKAPGDEMPLEVQPNDSSFPLARIVFQTGTNSPAHVEFVLAKSSKLTIADLKSIFGDYKTLPRIHWNSPLKVMFESDTPQAAFTCTLIAEVEPTEQDINNATVTGLTLRRDVRLPEN
ncbi:hypothetical protein [Gloeothece verrucosa]|nr:hypothetical protein [Gloeothece verrucosa]